MKKTPCAVLLGFCLAAHAALALEWQQTSVRIQAAPTDQQAEAVFHFTNTGAETVKITDVRSSCGCTVPALDKRDFAPGESGEIRAKFSFQNRVGHQSKLVTVTTDEPATEPYSLKLEVDIPELFDLRPRFLIWKRNEAPAAKELTLRVTNPDVIHPVSVETADKRFTATIVPSGDDPLVYRIVLEPSDTAEVMQTNVVVTMSEPADHPRTVTVYALVR